MCTLRQSAQLALPRFQPDLPGELQGSLGREITLQRAELGPNRTPDGLQKTSEDPRRKPRPCLCGCSSTTRGGRFLPGHQARLLGFIRRQLRTDPILAGLTEKQRAYARERNLLGWRGALVPYCDSHSSSSSPLVSSISLLRVRSKEADRMRCRGYRSGSRR